MTIDANSTGREIGLTHARLKELGELAERATPGPWAPTTTGVESGDHWYVVSRATMQSVAWMRSDDGDNEEHRPRDADFIAAWNPETAKALLDMLAEKDADCGHENPLGEMLRAQELERKLAAALAEVEWVKVVGAEAVLNEELRTAKVEAALQGSEESRLAGEQKLAHVQADRDRLAKVAAAVEAGIAHVIRDNIDDWHEVHVAAVELGALRAALASADAAQPEPHPEFSKFLAERLKDPEIKVAFDAAQLKNAPQPEVTDPQWWACTCGPGEGCWHPECSGTPLTAAASQPEAKL